MLQNGISAPLFRQREMVYNVVEFNFISHVIKSDLGDLD